MRINLQIATKEKNIPSAALFKRWGKAAMQGEKDIEITIRIVDEPEITELNETYRHKKGPTNVLAFPFEAPVETELLGDIVICAPIVNKEAIEQNKSSEAHWAHLTVHGVLHLLGYDHATTKDANEMEAQETKILAGLGLTNPYLSA